MGQVHFLRLSMATVETGRAGGVAPLSMTAPQSPSWLLQEQRKRAGKGVWLERKGELGWGVEGEGASSKFHENSVPALAEPLMFLSPTRKKINPGLERLTSPGDLAVSPPALIAHMAFSFISRTGTRSCPSMSPVSSTYEVVSKHSLNEWMSEWTNEWMNAE